MRDKAGFLAACGDVLTEMCVYYIAALFIVSDGWGVHLIWPLLCALVCAVVFAAVLKTPRSTPVLTALVLGLGGMSLLVFCLASTTPLGFGYCLVMAVGAGMAVGMSLYYTLHRPAIHNHLSHLDVLVMTLFVLLLCWQAIGLDGGAVALVVAVVFLDAASAVGLRMTEEDGSGGEDALRASLVALGTAVAVFLVVGLLTMLFSRSGEVTGNVLQGVGSFFAAIGSGVERFFLWLTSFIAHDETYEALELEGEIPSVADAETQVGAVDIAVNTTAVGIVLVAIVLAIAVIVAVAMRRKKISLGTKTAAPPSNMVVRRGESPMKKLWQRLREALRFRWTLFKQRNTPGGLLLRLEGMGRRRRMPRRQGETMRHFIRRMDPTGGLDPLADALDREYYGGQGRTMTSRQCRELGRYMTRRIRHG